MTALLKLTDVSMQYATEADPQYAVFQGVNLSIRAGERVAVVGRNGSGKSTLLRVMARIFAPTSGQVEWADGVYPQGSAHFFSYFTSFSARYS